MKPKYTIGTWIRFYNVGKLYIDIIQYIDKDVLGKYYYLTINNGHVSEDMVLESRTEQHHQIL